MVVGMKWRVFSICQYFIGSNFDGLWRKHNIYRWHSMLYHMHHYLFPDTQGNIKIKLIYTATEAL